MRIQGLLYAFSRTTTIKNISFDISYENVMDTDGRMNKNLRIRDEKGGTPVLKLRDGVYYLFEWIRTHGEIFNDLRHNCVKSIESISHERKSHYFSQF